MAGNLAKNSDARCPIAVAVIDSDTVETFTLLGDTNTSVAAC